MPAMQDGTDATKTEQGTRRFRQKRDAILAAAADAINEQSAKGMTFADVARRVGLGDGVCVGSARWTAGVKLGAAEPSLWSHENATYPPSGMVSEPAPRLE